MLLKWSEKLCPKDESVGGMGDFKILRAWFNNKSKGTIDYWGPSSLKQKFRL